MRKISFQCYQCGTETTEKNLLRNQITIKQEDIPYDCGQCGIKVNQDTQIKAHVLRKHKDGQD
jgi:uncharacterized Zn finger protein